MFSSVNLNAIAAGVGGFKIIGEPGGDFYPGAGVSVSGAGDVNGDGLDDLLVGSVSDDAGGRNAGAAYVVFGKAGDFGTVDLAEVAAGRGGFKIIGEAGASTDPFKLGDQAGQSVSGAGDINGDGFDDLLIGAPFNEAGGAAYVLFGKAGGFATVNLDDIAAGVGFKIVGERGGDWAGFSVSGAGDVNGDGVADLIVGAPFGTPFGAGGWWSETGSAYVLFGKAGGFGTVDLDEIAAGVGGFKIIGENLYDEAGFSVSGAGDVNGDGFDDLLVGAPENDADYPGSSIVEYGAAYLVFGKAGDLGTVDLGDIAAGAGGFKITGEALGDFAGRSVSGAGDVNGDGFDDLLVGAPSNDAGGDFAGAAYVLFGKAGGFDNIDLDKVAAGRAGFKIIGESEQDLVGYSVSGAGDLNGDGLDDLLVGARSNDAGGTNAGAAYLLFGKAGGFATVDLAEVAAGVGGFKIIGEAAYNGAGYSVSEAGDVNGDGIVDLLVGAPFNQAGGYNAGAAYLVFGRGAVTHAGTSGNDTLTGTAGADIMSGEAGNDRLFGEAGDDILDGGRGADRLTGGPGKDQLIGGPAADWVSYAEDPSGVTVDLVTGVATDGRGDPDALSGIEHVVGSQFADLLRGEGGDNVLKGLGGADAIYGAAGNDRLFGGDGADRLIGGLGADRLEGGMAGDKFVFGSPAETGIGPGNRDVILDFGQGQGDRIVLRAIDADATSGGDQAFAFIGGAAFSGTAGELRFAQAGGSTLVEGDVNGDGVADFQIELAGAHMLAAADFML